MKIVLQKGIKDKIVFFFFTVEYPCETVLMLYNTALFCTTRFEPFCEENVSDACSLVSIFYLLLCQGGLLNVLVKSKEPSSIKF